LSKDSGIADTVLYTDGGCHGNPGPGGWAWRAVDDSGTLIAEGSGFDPATTNNRMELSAVIAALRWAHDSDRSGSVVVRTDSQYVRQGITSWITRWRKNGWLTTARKPVKNAELWRTLDELNARAQPVWEWVRGHAGDPNNEACDQAVQQAIASRSGSS